MININIACYLVSNNQFEKAVIPEELMIDLIKSIREKGSETVHFPRKSIEVTGIFIPPKDCKYSLAIMDGVFDE